MFTLRDGLQSALNTGSQHKLLGTGVRGTLEKLKDELEKEKTGDRETRIRRLLLKSRFEVIWAYTKKSPIRNRNDKQIERNHERKIKIF